EDRRECVLYRDDDLETLLEHYLSHEDERAALAAAGKERVRQYGFEALWQHALERVEAEWPALKERAANRPAPSAEEQLLARTWQALSSSDGGDTALIGDLGAALAARPGTAALHHALGVAGRLAGAKG